MLQDNSSIAERRCRDVIKRMLRDAEMMAEKYPYVPGCLQRVVRARKPTTPGSAALTEFATTLRFPPCHAGRGTQSESEGDLGGTLTESAVASDAKIVVLPILLGTAGVGTRFRRRLIPSMSCCTMVEDRDWTSKAGTSTGPPPLEDNRGPIWEFQDRVRSPTP